MSDQDSAPAFVLYFNGSRIPIEREAEIKEINVTDCLNAPSRCTVLVDDAAGEWCNSQDYNEGAEIKIMLGYKDKTETVFLGEVTGLSLYLRKNQTNQVSIKGMNHMHRLLRSTGTAAFNQATDEDIIKQIAGDAGLSAGDIEALPCEHLFTLRHRQSPYAYLLNLADRYDCHFRVQEKKLHFKRLERNAGEDLVLEYNKTLIEFHPASDTSRIITDMEIRTWDYNKGEAVVGTAAAGDISAPGGKVINDSWGKAKAVRIDRQLLDQNAADKLALDWLAMISRDYVSGYGHCQGDTKLLAGTVVKVEGLGKKFSAKYFITSATHRLITTEGYTTSFTFTSSLASGNASAASDSANKHQTEQASQKDSDSSADSRKQKNPAYNNLKWLKDGAAAAKAFVGDTVTLTADTTDIDDNTWVTVIVHQKDGDKNQVIIKKSAPVRNNKVELPWCVRYKASPDPKYIKPEYVFFIKDGDNNIETGAGAALQVVDTIEINAPGCKGFKYKLVTPVGDKKSGDIGDDEKIKYEEIEPGDCRLSIDFGEA